MQSILLGNEISEHVFILSRKLKESAISQFRAKGKDVSCYVPWIAAGNSIDFDFSDLLLDPPKGVLRGHLVVDPSYLEVASAYVENALARVPAHPGLLPGAREDWIPVIMSDLSKIETVSEAIHLIKRSNVALGALYDELVEFILPLGDVHRGYSNADTRGIILRGFPASWNCYDIAIDLAHELGHHSLFVWQSVDSILTTSISEPIYSSVRKDFRPAIQSFHGAVALGFMLRLSQCWGRNAIADEVKRRHGRQYVGGTLEAALTEALATLKEKCCFTNIGAKMIAEMEALLEAGTL